MDVTEAEAVATLPLIGCHSQLGDKEKRRIEKGRERDMVRKGAKGFCGRGRGRQLSVGWRLEAEEEAGRQEGTGVFFLPLRTHPESPPTEKRRRRERRP